MSTFKRIVIIAGEESGDMHAAAFVQQLKSKYPLFEFSGMGGIHMQQAGVHLINNFARYGVTGFTEIFRHLLIIRQAFKEIKNHLLATKPDLLIMVDFPGFNLRLLKFVKQALGTKTRILYYISPQIWAWKANRMKLIQKYVDRMAVIFPFEKELYEKAGVPVSFVGHPLADTCKKTKFTPQDLGLPSKKRFIAMLPGSRRNEIERHMPILIKSAEHLVRQFSDLHFVVPVASTVAPERIIHYFKNAAIPYTVLNGHALTVMEYSDCVIVASGTASLECALLLKPMCIIYKAALLTYLIASKLMKVNYLGLCNLLQNKMIVPELLQYDCNPIEIARTVSTLLMCSDEAKRMKNRLSFVQASLSSNKADSSIVTLVEKELGLDPN